MNMPKAPTLNRQTGFTLIELIIVIVILGTLAVTAAPKFLDLSGDANAAVLKSVGGAMQSAGKLVYAKAAIQGLNNSELGAVDLNGDGVSDIETRYGYPSGSRNNGISKAMRDSFETDWIWSTDYQRTKVYLTFASLTHTSGAYVNQVPIVATNCYLIYYRAVSVGLSPTIEYTTSGC
tara:strand:- start:687 stop:1220 length:534 start_codon:yes stop_codon:yes gene_type:complete